jgi:hypothetical protein
MTKRNVAIGSSLVVLLLAALGYYYFFIKPYPTSPEDLVNVIQEKVNVPEGFDKVFTELGVKGLILVSERKQGEGPTIRAITPNGDPIDLCGPGAGTGKPRSCKLAPKEKFLSIVSYKATSTVGPCGYCPDAFGNQQECHTSTNKYFCHNKLHTKCAGACG